MASILGKRPRKGGVGYFLMDVFSITYLGCDKVEPENQLGTIKLYTGRGLQYLYRVDEVDIRRPRPSIKYGDTIPVTVRGPIPTMYDDLVYMEFDLFCGAYYGMIDLPWEPRFNEVSVKRVLFHSHDGTGRILVNMGRFASATIANVKVKLLNNNLATNVSGVIYAANSELDLADCASVLFLNEPNNRLIVGPDGVIPLSKSFVGLPLTSKLSVEVSLNVNGHDHTAIVSFGALPEGVDRVFIPKDKEARICVEVTWGVDIDEAFIYDTDYIKQRKITLWSADKSPFVVEEAVVLEFHALKDDINRSFLVTPTYHLHGISSNILSEVIYYCNERVHRSFEIDFNDKFLSKHDPVALFNLIQAAHHLQIKSLMDLTCRKLVNMVKTKTFVAIMKFFDMYRTYSEESIPSIDSILRQREKETLINRTYLVDVPTSSQATKRLRLFEKENPIFGRCLSEFVEAVDSQTRDLVKLLKAIRWLSDLIDGDAGLAHYLSFDDVERLLQILEEIDNSKDTEDDNVDIQCVAVRILSHVLSLSRFFNYSLDAVPTLVKLLSNPLADINIAGVIALTRIAFAFHTCRDIILQKGALEKAQEIVIKNRVESGLIEGVAKFLAVLCYRVLPHDKVNVALAISVNFLLKHSLKSLSMVSTCYALQYLTYGRQIEIEGDTWNRLIKGLVGHIAESLKINYTTDARPIRVISESIVVTGSALGVVGNIARWGHPNQIQSLANDSLLRKCLGKLLCFGSKKFCTEACKIISNIAARSQTWIQDMHKANLINPLCSLLENNKCEPDIRMEAAWAIHNGIYGDRSRQIDNYPENYLKKIGCSTEELIRWR